MKPECFRHEKPFVIFRGDDTDFPENQELILKITADRDFTGYKAHFQFQDYRVDFDAIPADRELRLIFPASETKNFSLGAADARLWITYGEGVDEKTRTLDNRIHVLVTNDVHEAYGLHCPQYINVTVGDPALGKLPMKSLPKYLHFMEFDDSYKAEAEEMYELLKDSATGKCSAVRRGNKLYRNYDWNFDYASEFIVRVNGSKNRFASIGVASVGSLLTERIVMSGKYSRFYKCLPGMTLDGINENGVVAEINVDGGPSDGWHGAGESSLNILAAVRWVLDNGSTAEQAAAFIANNVRRPTGMNFHFMIADANKTFIVENGMYAHVGGDDVAVLTNFPVVMPDEDESGVYAPEAMWETHHGHGIERLRLLANGSSITDAWFTNAYKPGNNWDSDFDSHEQHESAIAQWAKQGADNESHRNKTTAGGLAWWHTVHTTEYDIANKTMKVAVQETTDWNVFTVSEGGGIGTVTSVNSITPIDGNVTLEASDIDYDNEGNKITDVVDGISQNVGTLEDTVSEHTSDTEIHVSDADRDNWEDKYTQEQVDDKINQFAAHYLTWKDDSGKFVPFATHGSGASPAKGSLAWAKKNHTETNPQFWYCDEGHTPDKNDYCVVLADETHDNSTTRYMFVGDSYEKGFFRYQYTINETAFSEVQWAAINSLMSIDEDGNLCFDDTPIIDKDGRLLASAIAGVTGQDISVSSTDNTKISAAFVRKNADIDLITNKLTVGYVESGCAIYSDTGDNVVIKSEESDIEVRAKGSFVFNGKNVATTEHIPYEYNTTGLKDRSFNALSFNGTEYNLSTALASVTPTVTGMPRDLLIVATATTETTISYTEGMIKGDKPTIDGAGTWLITLTEYAANTWYCRQIKMEDAK